VIKAAHRAADTGAVNFWNDAERTQVIWRRGDPRLTALIAASRWPGLYALVHHDHVLKVGLAGIVRNGKQGTVGDRLDHHLSLGYANGNRPNEAPAWREFQRTLVGYELTVCTLRCDGRDNSRRRDLEKEAIREACGGVAWERMKGRERAHVEHGNQQRLMVEPGAVARSLCAILR
jgi:hypothetical protein